ncbi:hypothetical protein J2Z23_001496 [Lederbergia galactosidilyticus]|nr:hypothetical protein [Lederbergia galactosidilytica]
MFFKPNPNFHPKAVHTALFTTFIFWSLLLFVNAIFEQIQGVSLVQSSFAMLISGLSIFFLTEFVCSCFYRTK